MQPETVQTQPEQPPPLRCREKQRRQTKTVTLKGSKHFRLDQANAGIDKRHHFALMALFEAAILIHRKITGPVHPHAVGGAGHQQQNVHFIGIPNLSQARNIGVRPLKPDRIGIADVKGRFAQQRQNLLNAATLIEQARAFIRNGDLRLGAGGKMVLNLISQMMYIDNGLLNTGGG